MPKIHGFASATGITVVEHLDFWVDAENEETNFTVETLQLEWYGGWRGYQTP